MCGTNIFFWFLPDRSSRFSSVLNGGRFHIYVTRRRKLYYRWYQELNVSIKNYDNNVHKINFHYFNSLVSFIFPTLLKGWDIKQNYILFPVSFDNPYCTESCIKVLSTNPVRRLCASIGVEARLEQVDRRALGAQSLLRTLAEALTIKQRFWLKYLFNLPQTRVRVW